MYNEFGKTKFTLVTVITVAAVMLVAATTEMAITGYAFAYNRNQAASAANDCGNGQVPTNIGCQSLDSQIQGDENSVELTSQQTFPSEPPEPTGFTIEGTGVGEGQFTCFGAMDTWELEFSAQSDGTVSGNYEIIIPFGPGQTFTVEGVFTDGTTDGSTFSLTGEGEPICAAPGAPDVEVTISGDCGDDVTITYQDNEGENAQLIADVECTLT